MKAKRVTCVSMRLAPTPRLAAGAKLCSECVDTTPNCFTGRMASTWVSRGRGRRRGGRAGSAAAAAEAAAPSLRAGAAGPTEVTGLAALVSMTTSASMLSAAETPPGRG